MLRKMQLLLQQVLRTCAGRLCLQLQLPVCHILLFC
jgi:hypothetical protein